MTESKSKPSKKKAEKSVKAETEKIPFSVWFSLQKKAGILKFWQENEIRVFFKEKGLTELEEVDKYTELLKLY